MEVYATIQLGQDEVLSKPVSEIGDDILVAAGGTPGTDDVTVTVTATSTTKTPPAP